MSKIERSHIEVRDTYPEDYTALVQSAAERLSARLPFTPPFDTVIVGGSGLLKIADQIDFQSGTRVEIPEQEIGFPTGSKVEGHSGVMVAGVTQVGKNVLIRSRSVHPYNIHPLGLETRFGRLSQAEVATMYLHVLAELGGSRDVILSCACGGIANPAFAGEPPLFPEIPEVTIIGSDINFAYASALQGAYQGLGDGVRFPPSRESDEAIKQRFRQSWATVHRPTASVAEHVYCTSPSTAGYENRAQVRFALQQLFRLVGMSYSTEAERLSTLRQAFPNVLGIGVVTNPLLLLMRGGNDALVDVREKLGIPPSAFDEELLRCGLPLIPSKQEIEYIPATDLYIEFPANHEDVKKAGGVAVGQLGPVLLDMINSKN